MKPATPQRLIRLVAVGLLLLAGAATAGEITDRIWLKGRKEPQLVQITADSIDGIKAGPATFGITGIVRIQYGDAPFAFREAEQHREQGRHEEAIRLYETALRDKLCKRRWWLEPNCLYGIALCRLEEGTDLAAAATAFQKVLAEHPNCRFKPDAILGLGRVCFDQKKYRDAIKQFDELARLAATKNFEAWLYRAYLWKAKALREDNQAGSALELIQKIVGAARGEKYEHTYIAARTEEAVIYMAQGKYDKAVDLLGKLIQRIAPGVAQEIAGGSETRVQRIEAVCFNTLGQCYLQMGNKASDANKKQGHYHEALLSFLWTVVLYQRLPAEHAEALFYAAGCFEKLKQRSRATELQNELIQRYPDSLFKRKVQPEKKAAAK